VPWANGGRVPVPDLEVLDGAILLIAALLVACMAAIRALSKPKATKPKPETPRSKSADVAVKIITDQAKKDQGKINEARGDGDKLADLLNDRRRKR